MAGIGTLDMNLPSLDNSLGGHGIYSAVAPACNHYLNYGFSGVHTV